METPEQIVTALTEAFAHRGPAMIDVVVNRQKLSLPPTITLAQTAGFNLHMLNAMLHGDATRFVTWRRRTSGGKYVSEVNVAQFRSLFAYNCCSALPVIS